MIRTHGDNCKEPCEAEYVHNVGILEAEAKKLHKEIAELREKLYIPRHKTYTAGFNYLEPFDGWLVTDGEGFIKNFTGPRAQMDAQTLAYLLNT